MSHTTSSAIDASTGTTAHGRTTPQGVPLANGPIGQNPNQQLARIAELHGRLADLESSCANHRELLAGIMDLVRRCPQTVGTILVNRSPDGEWKIGKNDLDRPKEQIDEIGKWLLPKATASLMKGLPVIATSMKDRLECIAAPIQIPGCVAMVSVLKWPIGQAERSVELSLLLSTIRFLESATRHYQAKQTAEQGRLAAAALELVQHLQESRTIDQASTTLVAHLKQHLQCDQVFIGLRNRTGRLRIQAISEVPAFDSNAESVMRMKAVCEESIARDQTGAWPPLPRTGTHQLLAHKQFAGGDSFVIGTPLKNRQGKVIGALAMTGNRQLARVTELSQLLDALCEPVGETLDLVRRNQRSIVTRLLNRALAKRNRVFQLALTATLLLFGVVMATPWPYRIRCQMIAEPVERRFCVAPHDGLLQATLVEPGDRVEAGQPLAKLDGREILWELAGLTADKQRAEAKRDAHIAKHETPEAVMADLEVRTLKNKASLLQHRDSNLQILSPIDGMILSGSLDRRENYPVTKGQVLYEVAPLDQMRIEVGIPADEILHVEAGDEVTIYFDGLDGKPITGEIATIQPRAEVREQDNVFIAHVLLQSPEQSIRPGMRGIAKVITEERRIGWILFHHSAEQLRSWWF